jgi:opacity protein-like surface antigen
MITSRISNAAFCAALSCALLTAFAQASHAAEGADSGCEECEGLRSRFGVGLEIGYGYAVAPRGRQQGADVEDVRFIAINPHVRFRLWEKTLPSAWYHGRLDALLIGSILAQLEPGSGYAGAAIADLRYTILPGKKIQPYLEGGVGIGDLQFGLASQRDGFSFFLQGGAGVRWQVSRRVAVTASILWHHVSNAQIRLPNVGIDDVLFQVGMLSW